MTAAEWLTSDAMTEALARIRMENESELIDDPSGAVEAAKTALEELGRFADGLGG
jgi:hypothetical protein